MEVAPGIVARCSVAGKPQAAAGVKNNLIPVCNKFREISQEGLESDPALRARSAYADGFTVSKQQQELAISEVSWLD